MAVALGFTEEFTTHRRRGTPGTVGAVIVLVPPFVLNAPTAPSPTVSIQGALQPPLISSGAIVRVPTVARDPIGELTFTASVDHASVTSYEARLYTRNTTTPVLATLNLGKPTPDGSNLITVSIRSWLDGQAAGTYEVRVAAVTGTGSFESTESNEFVVPLA